LTEQCQCVDLTCMVCDSKLLAPLKSSHDCVEELKRSLAISKVTIHELKEENDRSLAKCNGTIKELKEENERNQAICNVAIQELKEERDQLKAQLIQLQEEVQSLK
jgi:chromosome segregation ATPase